MAAFVDSKSSSGHASDDDDAIMRVETATTLQLNRASSRGPIIEGSSRLYADGELRYVPMPTADPKDPLNLPDWRKITIVATLCFFGAMAVAAELILAALIPVFILEYNGFSPHILDGIHGGFAQAKGGGASPSVGGILSELRGGPPIWKINLIATLPTVVIGVSNYFLVPLSMAVGRRPVILICGCMAWCGALWAGSSTSLNSHLAARALNAMGAGTVETLLPLVVQDISFIHWRNRAFSAIWATQGIVIVTLGICSPLILIATSWRWLYRITAIAAAIGWLILFFTLPETLYFRSKEELRGEPLEPLPRGFLRPPLNPTRYGKRTWRNEFGMFNIGFHWSNAWDGFLASVKSFFFPNIFWIICLNGAFASISLAAGQTASSVLLTEPWSWPFRLLGLAVLPIVVASVFVAIFAGYLADKISNRITKFRHKGRREPEVHLLNMIVPLLFAIAGCVMFGVGGTYIGHVSWGVFVVGIGFLAFGVLCTTVLCSVYVVEAYPDWAGPVLVNSGSFRNIIGFGFSFKVVDWIGQLGFVNMFGIYAAVIAIISLFGIPVFVYGKQIRSYCGRFIHAQDVAFGNKAPGSGGGGDDDDRLYTNSGKMVANAPFEPKPALPVKEEMKVEKRAKRQVQVERAQTEKSDEMAVSEPAPRENGSQKKGIDWENVKEWLNIRSSWRDSAMH